MSNGTILLWLGAGLGAVATVSFIVLKIWLHSYGKKVREDLKRCV